MGRAAVLTVLALLLAPAAGQADTRQADTRQASTGQADLGQVCLHVADAAAEEAGIPRAVLRALTRTETGRARGGQLEPWPWTVNMEGAGHWFDTPEAALAYVRREQARGARSFDVGCFQINHRWHGDAFASLEEMFDPMANARYAARFMADLHAETGDWSRAAGFYHSRTPEFFGRYRARFDRILAAAETEAPTPPPVLATRVAARIVDESARRAAGALPGDWRAQPVVARSAGGVAVRLAQGESPLRRSAGRLIDPGAARPLFAR